MTVGGLPATFVPVLQGIASSLQVFKMTNPFSRCLIDVVANVTHNMVLRVDTTTVIVINLNAFIDSFYELQNSLVTWHEFGTFRSFLEHTVVAARDC